MLVLCKTLDIRYEAGYNKCMKTKKAADKAGKDLGEAADVRKLYCQLEAQGYEVSVVRN